MVIYSDRDVFIGGHVTPDVKDALKEESRRSSKTMSRFIYEAVVAKLQQQGHDIKMVDDFPNESGQVNIRHVS